MGFAEEIMEALIALFIIIVFFWYVFPELAKATGTNIWWMNLVGFLMVIAVILKIISAIRR